MISKFKNLIKIIILIFKVYGLNLKKLKISTWNTKRFLSNLINYNKLNKNNNKFILNYKTISPILTDYDEQAGSISGYFMQDLWAARLIYKKMPKSHTDIGSRIDGFISNLLVFMDVTVVDIRNLRSKVEGLKFKKSDATDLKEFKDNSVQSLSSLHAAEHFGLGRYGDKIDPNGHIKFINNLERILAIDGHLLFSVPLGNDVVIFNSHRAFRPKTIISYFKKLNLVSFSAINKNNELILDIDIEDINNLSFYKIGLFEFTKKF